MKKIAAALAFALVFVLSCVARPYNSGASSMAQRLPESQNGTEKPAVESAANAGVLFGFDQRTLRLGNNSDNVIAETLAGKGNITSKYTLGQSEALDAGMKWIGVAFTEIGSGVFRSSDSMRQFRIDKNSLAGAHAPGIPHVHFEAYRAGENRPAVNNHVPVRENNR